jgi:TATA-box binding protein (TBP) (component of TFIID and TFIIIB)
MESDNESCSSNEDIDNEDIDNADIDNEDIDNEDIDNEDIDNEDIDNEDVDNEDPCEGYNSDEDNINYLKEYNHSRINTFNLLDGIMYYKDQLRILDSSLKISTITITCNMNISFHIENIGLYLNDFDEILIEKHYNKQSITAISITNLKIKKKNLNKKIVKKGNFLNQISFIFDTALLMNSTEKIVTTNNKKKKLNLKLFKNGSIQCTGLGKDLNILEKCFEILFKKLKKRKAILVNNKFEEKYFVDDVNMLSYLNIKNFNIRMINTNFLINYNIKRLTLQELLLKDNIYVDYDPNESVSVNVKYKLKNKKEISIKIFESGSISITGANLCDEISEAYYFINRFLFSNSKLLLIKPIDAKKIVTLISNII